MCKATHVEIRGFHISESEWKPKDKEASFPKKKYKLASFSREFRVFSIYIKWYLYVSKSSISYRFILSKFEDDKLTLELVMVVVGIPNSW